MTTTVKRGAGRPAAAARTAKHAQRNIQTGPNPTVAVVQEVASELPRRARQRENFEAAIAVEKGGYGRMTVVELRARLEALTGQKAPARLNKGQLMADILNAERRAERAEHYAEAQAEQDLLEQDADSPGGAYVPPASSNGTAPEAEAKGSAKALRIQTALQPHGWIYASLTGGEAGRVTATFTRGIETLTVAWDSGVFNYDETAHAIGDRVVKVRNVSAAIKLGSRPEAEAEKDLERVARNRTFNKAKVREAGDPVRRKLPFDPAEVTEVELSALLAGKTIEWTNRITRGTETATVTDRSAKYFRVVDAPSGRTLQFVSKEEGFKACRLEDIVRVGGSLRKRAQKAAA